MLDGPNITDDEDDSPPMSQVAHCLREAGSYDATMTNSEMLQLYRVLNHSKTTATAEDEHRRTAADANSNYDFVDEMRLHSEPVTKSQHSETQMDVTERNPSQTPLPNSPDENINAGQRWDDFDEVDVFNCAPTKHPPLPLISYKPKYKPPLYCDPKFIKFSLEEKKRLLYQHHERLIQIYDSTQRRSQKYAPLGKPIMPDAKFGGTLLKTNDKPVSYDLEDEDLFNEDDHSEIYITKTGRQTKRKLYTESLTDTRRDKPPPRKVQDTPAGSQPKRKNPSALNNEQIMKRSKIFSPKADRLFDNLKKKEEQDKEAKKETKKFVDSLDINSDDDYVDDSTDVAELVHSEEPFIPRRIVPPNPGKNLGKARGRGGKSKANNAGKKAAAATSIDVEMEDKTQSSISGKMGTCPICGLEFAQDVLATHADNCIDTYEQASTRTTVLFNGSDRITCENCDQMLPLNTEYEVHVRECLAKAT